MAHTFHIPVMGLGFTMDSPIKVAKYGIDSVVSIADDLLIEQMREAYCKNLKLPFEAITTKMEDFHANRITTYLNFANDLTNEAFEELKKSVLEKGSELQKYIDLLPDVSDIKQKFIDFQKDNVDINKIKDWLKDNLSVGKIDVNIMTKLDKPNYIGKEQLPQEFNDAHAALRGYAKSDLDSSIVLSAGLNPRLYGYFEKFEDFYPDANNYLKKKIVIKVSDYRSALIQGKFFAKKGLWVSEYRIESGLNCGGHAFATDGHLLGLILEEFNKGKEDLITTTHELFINALKDKNRTLPNKTLPIKLTVQGGVGTHEEHQFLLDHYKVDSVGWGSPFLLVPEATTVDKNTRNRLVEAKEKDLYLSNISPFGIPFNSLKIEGKEISKLPPFKGSPGSSCPKKILISNTEFTEKPICTASSKYMKLKIAQVETLNLNEEQYKKQYDNIVAKACLCIGLGTSSLKDLGVDLYKQITTICPGPNLAYFSAITSLKNMVGHIYGKEDTSVKVREDRPNVFIKELSIYVNFLKDKLENQVFPINKKDEKYYKTFVENINNGIEYYRGLFNNMIDSFKDSKNNILKELDHYSELINGFELPVVPVKVEANK